MLSKYEYVILKRFKGVGLPGVIRYYGPTRIDYDQENVDDYKNHFIDRCIYQIENFDGGGGGCIWDTSKGIMVMAINHPNIVEQLKKWTFRNLVEINFSAWDYTFYEIKPDDDDKDKVSTSDEIMKVIE